MKAYPMRARIRNEGTGPARVDIYDDIGAGGWFSEGYTPSSFADAIKGVSGPLDVHINSGGGDVSDGIAIASAIRAYPGRKRTVVDGMAASIASVIAQAGDERIVEPGAMLMIHDPLTACMGNQADFEKVAETLGKHGDNLAQQYADRSGTKSAAEWREVMRQEAWYTADEAVAAGLADRVGTAEARLPQGIDVDALAARAPGRIMAALRSMPRAAVAAAADGSHAAFSGTHSHAHTANGDQGGDSMHEHEHSHDGDAAHGHDHQVSDRGRSRPRAADGGDDEPAVCKTCNGRKRLPHPGTGKNGIVCPGCGGTGTYDPDDDGDDDSTAEGDTDHDYVEPDGSPGPKAAVAGMSSGELQAAMRPAMREFLLGELRAAGLLPGADGFVRVDAFYQPLHAAAVDNSPWDGGKAMANGAASDDPAAFYKGICAGRKEGDPAEQDSWALPYRYHPGDPVNAAGVKNALSRLPQTEGLTNAADAKATLQAAMKKVSPDWEPDDSGAGDSAGKGIFAAGAAERFRAAMPALKGARA